MSTSPSWAKVRRRIRTVPLVFLAWAVVTVALPVLVVLAVAVDAVRWIISRTPWMAIRLVVFLWVYLLAEVGAVIALAAAWLVPARRIEWTYRLQAAWVSVLFGAVRLIFGISTHVEGTDVLRPGPILVFARHASIVDNLLPHRFIVRPSGIRLRYVLKSELLSDPALDIGGLRLPNYFVTRGSRNAAAEIAGVAGLAAGLGTNEGVLIFPEGTRFRPDRRERAIALAGRRNPAVAELAGELTSVMPPRLGGPLALLEAGEMDVVVLAHRGLGGFATVSDIWSGAMVGRRVEIRLTRIAHGDIPTDREARIIWLFELWRDVDRWVRR